MKHTISQKSKSKSEKPIKPDELAQFLGDITMNKQELLTNDHFDSEVRFAFDLLLVLHPCKNVLDEVSLNGVQKRLYWLNQ